MAIKMSIRRRNMGKTFIRKSILISCILYSIAILVFLFYEYTITFISIKEYSSNLNSEENVLNLKHHSEIVSQYFEMRKDWKTSKVGSLIFKNEIIDLHEKNRTFVILVWKYWKWLRNRHVTNYGQQTDRQNILEDCSVKNCIFSGNETLMNSADVIVIHLMPGTIPQVPYRKPSQLWVFLTDESPRYSFIRSINTSKQLEALNNVFNWSMTYRTNADVPVPYGRTVALEKPVKENVTDKSIEELIPYWKYKRSDVLVTILLSNCLSQQSTIYLKELQKYINIDVFGMCPEKGLQQCPGLYMADCELLNKYYFYLVMENSICSQYFSEKVFHHAYAKGAIPIILGTAPNDCKTLLPPNSYLHTGDFLSHKDLADKILSISQNKQDFFSYHLWRNHFKVVNEHGYFGTKSYHLCRLCQALNYNEEKQQIYDFQSLSYFLDSNIVCT